MPPAISDDESDQGVDVPLATKPISRAGKSPSSQGDNADGMDLGEPQEVNGGVSNEEEDEVDEDDEEDGLEEEEYVVEKIAGHMLNPDGEPLFHVKWEGYERKSDMTWEPEDNLRENAQSILDQYFRSIGGREKIYEETKTALKTKKRGRPSAGAQQPSKKPKRNGHPMDEEPPMAAKIAQWKPPAGSWEEDIAQLDACEDEDTGKLMVYLTWKNGAKTQHETSVVYKRCPQKMLQFYERHVRIIKRDPADATD